jgi:hypothetical protein
MREIEEYYNARRAYEKLDLARKMAGEQMREAEQRLIAAFHEQGWYTSGPQLADGTKVILRNTAGIRLNDGNRADAIEWVRQRYGDSDAFCEVKLSKAKLEKQIKEDIEKGELQEHDLPESLSYQVRPVVTVQGWSTVKP